MTDSTPRWLDDLTDERNFRWFQWRCTQPNVDRMKAVVAVVKAAQQWRETDDPEPDDLCRALDELEATP